MLANIIVFILGTIMGATGMSIIVIMGLKEYKEERKIMNEPRYLLEKDSVCYGCQYYNPDSENHCNPPDICIEGSLNNYDELEDDYDEDFNDAIDEGWDDYDERELRELEKAQAKRFAEGKLLRATGCKCAIETDEYHGWECEITGNACVYLFPDSKACARDYGEGPDAVNEEDEINE